jgi:phage tail sheath protein FI
MPFQLSPGVLVVEKDLTNIIPAVATSIGGYVGNFVWGPAQTPVTVASEIELVKTFGKPNLNTYVSFFSAANFLSYSNNLVLIRQVGSTTKNAVSTGTALMIPNEDEWKANYEDGSAAVGEFAAKYPGALGNSLLVSMADSATFAAWAYKDQFDAAPSTSDYVNNITGGASLDELHIVVIDEDGLFTGTPGTLLEKWAHLSKASDAKSDQGANNYYRDALLGSQYIYWMDHTTAVGSGTSWGSSAQTAIGTPFKTMTGDVSNSLLGGVSEASLTSGEVQAGYDYFVNAEKIDVNLIITGGYAAVDAKYVIDNIADVRRDCVVFVSPQLVSVFNNSGSEATDVIAERDGALNANSSYAFMDSGWKYQYDKYNDVYRWVPLNPDIAGLCARTDFVADPWFSPGGYNRGIIKNVVKLAYSPDKADRDNLYKKGINSVISEPGQGTLLIGDKTMLAKPGAFDRINVRRLFIVLEKAIATAAKYMLFEFNDTFTRASFRNMTEPFLRDVKGRRGIIDFTVICDTTNNTGEVIDRNEFVADIYIKPARSINYITLNFIAVRTGVSFSEVVGTA